MAVTLIATVGATNSNSLVSVADADQYFGQLLSADQWSDLDPGDKARALITATLALEEMDWWGEPANPSQALAWPRRYTLASDGTSIPKEIVSACCEHALVLAQAAAASSTGRPASRWARLRAEGLTSYRLGDVSASFAPSSSAGSTASALAQFSGRVQRLISRWLRTGWESDSGRRPRRRTGTRWPWEY